MASSASPTGTASSSRSPQRKLQKKPPLQHHGRSISSDLRRTQDSNDANEESPLLAPTSLEDEDDERNKTLDLLDDEPMWPGEELMSRSSWYMLLLTLGGFGLQMGWSVEMSNGSPYLLSLGLDKALLALVWIAGPLSGVLVQPYVGIKSDRCRSRFGKRRPFMVGGAIATMISVLVLAWAREIVGGIFGIFGAGPDSQVVKTTTMLFAVLFVYVLDFAINVLQAAIRAFAVDCAPSHQQESANAWISRTIGVGNIVGMFAGGLNLPKLLPWLGNTQFKVLCALAAISLALTVGISTFFVSERDPRTEPAHPNSEDSMTQLAKSLWRSLFHLPPQISQVCKVQFLAWMGWFPFLFYTTTYIGEIYVEPFFEANPHMSQREVDELWDRGTRRGTVALLAFSIVTFTASILLPFIVVPTYEAPKSNRLPGTLLTPHSTSDLSNSGHLSKSRRGVLGNLQHNLSTATSLALKRIQVKSLTLRRTWLLSHLLFAGCMWMTFLVRGTTLATVLVGLVGIPWAVTMWAPFALISSEISKREAIRRGLIRPPPTREGQLLAAGEDDIADQAGVVLGIHNVSISAPQVIATIVGSILFKFLQKPRGTPGDSSVAWFFRLAGLCAVAAAYLTTKVKDDRQDVEYEYEYEERPRTAGTM